LTIQPLIAYLLTVQSLYCSGAAKGGTSLVFYPAVLVMGHFTITADHNLFPSFYLCFTVRTNFSNIIHGHSPLTSYFESFRKSIIASGKSVTELQTLD
jgi:hypothetical protein